MGSAKGVSKQPPTDEEYAIEVEKFKKISNELGRALKYEEMSKYNLRSSRWYVQYSKNNKVHDYNSFIEFEIGMMPRYMVSKETAIKCILELQSTLNRPLLKKDLSGIKNNSVGTGVIKRYWGGFNEMKKALGLEIVGQNLRDVERSLFSIKRDVVKVCAYILEKENRYIVTLSDWDKLEGIASYQTCCKWFIAHGSTLREFIQSIGFDFVKSGDGVNFFFDDNEHTQSQYELEFSKGLRELGLEYNINYYRDIRYSTFIQGYKGFLNCDYVIKYKSRTIYVEIVGMLRDYKEWYYQNKSMSSKSREKYRLTLMKKEEMLKNMQLEYYILFPCDINQDIFEQIFQ